MKFTLSSLTLAFKQDTESVPLAGTSYFYGQMGAGKTSIARLIDYCLGADIALSPALQSEFVQASLTIELERAVVQLERPRDSGRVIARWEGPDGPHQVSVPARDAAGEVIPNTGVETLSDLLFWLSGVTPPKVRRSKTRDNSELERLSIRDLLWYCYLDQDTIDSDFFHLDESANRFKRLKSRDVLRFVIGFHEERVAEIEGDIDRARIEREGLLASIAGLTKALKQVGADSEEEIVLRVAALRERADAVAAALQMARDLAAADSARSAGDHVTHAADALRDRSRQLASTIAGLEQALEEIGAAMDRDTRHLHEIETLTLKFRRSVSAKAILTGVVFTACPRCAHVLPERPDGCCVVCGQEEGILAADPTEIALLERDAKARVAELRDVIVRHEAALERLRRERDEVLAQKSRIERERNEASSRRDSAYLSTMLMQERERTALLQDAANLERLAELPKTVSLQREQVERLAIREAMLRTDLRKAREAAERDSSNLDRLKELFLECLLRAGVPGISSHDSVEIRTPSFLPEVFGPAGPDATVTTFGNMSSGGKKTLFKCCFAVAVHRLAVQVGATLPALLLIDSPMKNISERENRAQFEGFHRLLYELKATELTATQLILIDKEFCEPPDELRLHVDARHMRPDDPEFPPLIRYYHGH